MSKNYKIMSLNYARRPDEPRTTKLQIQAEK